jgi:putative ABC transport system permease protein
MAVIFASTLEEWAHSTNNPFLRKMQFEMEPAGGGVSVLREPYGRPLLVLMTIVALLLLLACTNIATMLSARGATREPEMALRVSLGASRLRLLRQGLTESMLLAVAAGIPAIVLAKFGAAALVRIISSGRPIPGLPPDFMFPVAPDSAVLGFAGGVALATGLLFGLLPAVRVVNISPLAWLHPVSRASESRSRRLLGNGLVVAQVAMSVVLLSGAALFLRYLSSLENADLGFQRDHILLVSLDLANSGYDPPRLSSAVQQLLIRLEAIPGVRSASLCAASPISGAGANHAIAVEGYTPPKTQSRDVAENWVMENWVSPRYFETIGTPILSGRDFTLDDQGSARVAIVNRTMARHYFADSNPIGRHVRFDGEQESYEIIGVAGDAKYMEIREATYPTIYLDTFQQNWVDSQFAIRTKSRPEAVIPDVWRAVNDVVKTMSVSHFTTMEEQVDASIVPERLLATLSTMFGLLGALLAAIGLYGLLAFTVARRVKEIGLRIALGASHMDVVRMVVFEALGLIGAGLAFGALLAFWGKHFTANLIHDLPAQNAVPVVLGVLGILAVGVLAAYIPARRAARVDPMVALRCE